MLSYADKVLKVFSGCIMLKVVLSFSFTWYWQYLKAHPDYDVKEIIKEEEERNGILFVADKLF